jgi:hypothetical protein
LTFPKLRQPAQAGRFLFLGAHPTGYAGSLAIDLDSECACGSVHSEDSIAEFAAENRIETSQWPT